MRWCLLFQMPTAGRTGCLKVRKAWGVQGQGRRQGPLPAPAPAREALSPERRGGPGPDVAPEPHRWGSGRRGGWCKVGLCLPGGPRSADRPGARQQCRESPVMVFMCRARICHVPEPSDKRLTPCPRRKGKHVTGRKEAPVLRGLLRVILQTARLLGLLGTTGHRSKPEVLCAPSKGGAETTASRPCPGTRSPQCPCPGAPSSGLQPPELQSEAAGQTTPSPVRADGHPRGWGVRERSQVCLRHL